LYQALDQLSEKVEILNDKEENKGDRDSMENIGNKVKQLNSELDTLGSMLENVEEVNYQANKIEYLYKVGERSLMWQDILMEVIERLMALQTMHKDSPQIEVSIQKLQTTQGEVGDKVDGQHTSLQEVKASIVSLVTLFKGIQEKQEEMMSKLK
jgi:DNA repair ATPase RecN